MAEGNLSGIEQGQPVEKAATQGGVESITGAIDRSPLASAKKNLFHRLIPSLQSSKGHEFSTQEEIVSSARTASKLATMESVTGDEHNAFGRSVMGETFMVVDADTHFASILKRSRTIRTDSKLRLSAACLVAEGVPEQSIIEVLEKGTKASDEAVDEVFKKYIGNYAEAGKLSAEAVENLWIGKSVLEVIRELEKRIPRQGVLAILEKTNSYKSFANSVNISDKELLDLSSEIAPIINKDFNFISLVKEAREYFVSHLSKNKLFTPEQREEALQTLERWYTGNYNPETGKITLYRFVDLTAEMLDDIEQNGIRPRGVHAFGSEEAAIQYLDNYGGSWYAGLANTFRRQKAGEDISQFIERYKRDSRANFKYDLATYWITEKESQLFGGTQYRVSIELDPKEAWRAITLKSIKEGRIDDPHYSLSEISFDTFSKGQFEWTVLGNIPNSKINEIKHLPSGKVMFGKKTP